MLQRIDMRFKESNIYMAPVGEIESFNKASGKHGSAWVSEVLEKEPDLGSASYEEIRKFVASWHL